MLFMVNVEDKVILLKTLICREVKLFDMQPKEFDFGIIDVDYSLIRYLGQVTEINDININNCGYIIIKRRDNTTTTLGRFILEYYSKYDKKLKEILENKQYEINHINSNKLDNRIENLEILTHQDNIKHSKGLNYNVVYKSEDLKKLQKLNKKEEIDKQYLSKISSLFFKSYKKYVKDEIIKFDTKILKCCYLKFNNNKFKSNIKEQSVRESKYISNLNEYKLMSIFNTFFIKEVLKQKKKYIYEKIIKNNISMLNKYINRYSAIKQILKKYKIIDKDFKEELKFDRSNSRNILLDFYKIIYDLNRYIIEDGNILLTTSIKDLIFVNGKYKAFLALYLLGLLKRQNDISKPNIISNRIVHTPSFIHIPFYTDEILKQANKIAKKLMFLNLNKFSYFLIRQEFGEEIADSIYKNKKSKANYKYCLRAKEDIIEFIKTDKDILNFGFMKIEEIFEHLQGLNNQRKIREEDYNEIYNGFINFIKSLLLYNTDTKQKLEELGFIYISLNFKTIENIKKYQEELGFNFPISLKPKEKVIVLKKLIK